MPPPERPTGDERFTAALRSEKRGRPPDPDSLAARQPTQAAHDKADRICRDVADGRWTEAVNLLNDERRAVAGAPLLKQLVEALTDALHPKVLADPSIVCALYALWLSPHVENRIIVRLDVPARLHLWPDENQYKRATKPVGTWLNAVDTATTACRRRLATRGCEHATRGDWFDTWPTLCCPECTDYEQDFLPESTERVETGIAREIEAMLGPKARSALHAGILNHASAGTLEPQTVIAAHVADYQEEVRAAAVDVLLADGEASCMRILGEYQGIRQASSQDLATTLTSRDWEEIVEDAFYACGHGLTPGGARQGVERQLARAITMRLRSQTPRRNP